jgi:hypothetical protein
MRLPTILTTVLVLAVAVPVLAGDDDRDPVDISKVKDKLKVLTDGDGHYIVVVHDKGDNLMLYGDGTKFYKQRVFSRFFDGSTKNFSARFWSPRVDSQADLHHKKGKWFLKCKKRKTSLTELGEDDAKKVLADGKFMDVYWQRSAYQLARDDRGTYYYVDRFRDEFGGKGHRLFIGQKGNLKKTKLTNIVSDSEGDIYATKKGELRFVSGEKSYTWIRGDKKVELKRVPVEKNVEMIYGDLGVYLGESLGTPCDDM